MRGKYLDLRRALLASTALVLAAVQPAMGQDATWVLNPGNGNFNNGANWTPAAIPTGTAFFDTSNTTALYSSGLGIGGWTG